MQTPAREGPQLLWAPRLAVASLVFYLALEAQVTHLATSSMLTELIALCVLDVLSQPWATPAVQFSVEDRPKHLVKRQTALRSQVAQVKAPGQAEEGSS